MGVQASPAKPDPHPGTHITMRNDQNEETPTAIGEGDRQVMCHEQNKLISTAIDEGEELELMVAGT